MAKVITINGTKEQPFHSDPFNTIIKVNWGSKIIFGVSFVMTPNDNILASSFGQLSVDGQIVDSQTTGNSVALSFSTGDFKKWIRDKYPRPLPFPRSISFAVNANWTMQNPFASSSTFAFDATTGESKKDSETILGEMHQENDNYTTLSFTGSGSVDTKTWLFT